MNISITENDLRNMSSEDISDFIQTFSYYMESEKEIKKSMQSQIDELKTENSILHNRLDDTPIECNDECTMSDEEYEALSNAYEDAGISCID